MIDELRECVTNKLGISSTNGKDDLAVLYEDERGEGGDDNGDTAAAKDDETDIVYDDDNEGPNNHQILNQGQTTRVMVNGTTDAMNQAMQSDGTLGHKLMTPGSLTVATSMSLTAQLHQEVERIERAGTVLEEEYCNEYQTHYYH